MLVLAVSPLFSFCHGRLCKLGATEYMGSLAPNVMAKGHGLADVCCTGLRPHRSLSLKRREGGSDDDSKQLHLRPNSGCGAALLTVPVLGRHAVLLALVARRPVFNLLLRLARFGEHTHLARHVPVATGC